MTALLEWWWDGEGADGGIDEVAQDIAGQWAFACNQFRDMDADIDGRDPGWVVDTGELPGPGADHTEYNLVDTRATSAAFFLRNGSSQRLGGS